MDLNATDVTMRRKVMISALLRPFLIEMARREYGRITMPDVEKAIKGLKQCLKGTGCSSCENCPYNSAGVDFRCRVDLRNDAIAALKEREPKQAVITSRIATGLPLGKCPTCGAEMCTGWAHCVKCGQAVKWDG